MNKSNARYETINPTKNYPVNIHKFHFREGQERAGARHWHRSLEIIYHENTNGTIILNGLKKPLKGNMLTLINSRCVHELYVQLTEASTSLVLIIPYDFLKKEIPDYDRILFDVAVDDETVIRLLNEMYEASVSREPFASMKVTSLTYELLHYLCSCCLTFRDESMENHFLKGQSRAQEVASYLNENYPYILGTQEISDHFGYSREAFSRKFRQHFSCTLHDYLTKLRLRQAIPGIRKKDQTLFNIAVKTGFPNLRSMNRSIIEYTGCSPSDIRNLSEEDYRKLMEERLMMVPL